MGDVVIVGHGTSLKGSGLGSMIDSYDCPIVRFNSFMHGCGVEDRGSRVDYLCTTTLQWKWFTADGVIPTREVWVYQPNNNFKYADKYKEGPLYVADLREWLYIYKGVRTGRTLPKFCKGLAAVIIAAKRLDISSILLFGFDNLWVGERRNFETMGLGRNKGIYTTRHDYAAERKMFDIISVMYEVTISHIDMWDIKWVMPETKESGLS
jgi:hypothetical protein